MYVIDEPHTTEDIRYTRGGYAIDTEANSSMHLACTTAVAFLLTRLSITTQPGCYTMASNCSLWSMLYKHLAVPLIHPRTVVQLQLSCCYSKTV